MGNWEIKIIDKGYTTLRSLYIFRKKYDHIEFLSKDGELKIVPLNTDIPDEPFMRLEPEVLQALADELNNVGYKPQKGFIEGKLLATENHLEDLRKLLKLTTKK